MSEKDSERYFFMVKYHIDLLRCLNQPLVFPDEVLPKNPLLYAAEIAERETAHAFFVGGMMNCAVWVGNKLKESQDCTIKELRHEITQNIRFFMAGWKNRYKYEKSSCL